MKLRVLYFSICLIILFFFISLIYYGVTTGDDIKNFFYPTNENIKDIYISILVAFGPVLGVLGSILITQKKKKK